jgi:hypothetical protein
MFKPLNNKKNLKFEFEVNNNFSADCDAITIHEYLVLVESITEGAQFNMVEKYRRGEDGEYIVEKYQIQSLLIEGLKYIEDFIVQRDNEDRYLITFYLDGDKSRSFGIVYYKEEQYYNIGSTCFYVTSTLPQFEEFLNNIELFNRMGTRMLAVAFDSFGLESGYKLYRAIDKAIYLDHLVRLEKPEEKFTSKVWLMKVNYKIIPPVGSYEMSYFYNHDKNNIQGHILYPFPDHSWLLDAPLHTVKILDNGSVYLRLTEDCSPHGNDRQYIRAYIKFYRYYLEQRKKYL